MSLQGTVNQVQGKISGTSGLNGTAHTLGRIQVKTSSTNQAQGRASSVGSVTGTPHTLGAAFGKSAYQIAVKNGFKGTEKEWLATLGGRGIKTIEQISSDGLVDTYLITYTDGTTSTYTLTNGAASAPVYSTVTLFASKWVGDNSPYSQVVTIDKATEYSKVDLQPSSEQLAIFHDKDLAFVTENDDGVITVYAIGDKPTNDYTMQVTIAEVVV